MNSKDFHTELNNVRKKAKQDLANWVKAASKSTCYMFRDDKAIAQAVLIKINKAYLKAIADTQLSSVETRSFTLYNYEKITAKALAKLK